jgi:hypothetical protein
MEENTSHRQSKTFPVTSTARTDSAR